MVYAYIVIAILIISAYLLWLRRKEDVQEGDWKMPQGLQIFNSSGDIVLDYTEETYQVYGVCQTIGGQSGVVSDERIASDTFVVPYCFRYVTPVPIGTTDYEQAISVAILPNFIVTEGELSWTYASKHQNKDAYVEMYFLYGGETK